ncbi:MAG: type I phosphomannose isomerase catalytic subunit [Candidatus Methylacidiphilales bacterium]
MALLTFDPVYQERMWGGQNLRTLFHRDIPSAPIGESWELCDRPEAQTRCIEQGSTLGELWSSPQRATLFGTRAPDSLHFPLLIKILDAQDKLSLQVHPPAHLAASFNGEPKTECWYFLETSEDALIYVGLKRGTTRHSFERALSEKKVTDCFHTLNTKPGELMFLPSGRVHAIGAGNLILEIQQNSDTTFRVYDWDRVDAKTGKPRDLHVEPSLACIDFSDIEPIFAQPHGSALLRCPLFHLDRLSFFEKEELEIQVKKERGIYGFVSGGELEIEGRRLPRGSSFWLTADSGACRIQSHEIYSELITATWP